MSEARRKAWETRREKYGPRGHSGNYSRSLCGTEAGRGALRLVARLHIEGVLSEGQVSAATGLSRVAVRELSESVRSQALAARQNRAGETT